MDVRTISGAAYSRPPAAVAPADIAPALDGAKGASAIPAYLSPVYHFDPVAKLAILSYRDTTTGDVTTQIPSEKVVQQYRRTRGEAPGAAKAAETAPTATRDASPAPVKADIGTTAPSAPPGSSAGTSAPVAAAVPTPSTGTTDTTPPASAPAAASADAQRVSLSV